MPRVAVYVGEGASHSWIWFCDLLERLGLYDVRFIADTDILAGRLEGIDILLVGGGDTYAMAGSLGGPGARMLESFVRGGGLYHGSCAGAYLVLSGVDLAPFTPFNLIDARMLNVMAEPPEPRCLEHKYLAPYGEEWVFHPVYGEVELRTAHAGTIAAPLFGGPVLEVSRSEEVLAEYSCTTSRAAFPWPRDEADRFIRGTSAVAWSRLGAGTVLISGPHLEHPLFVEANCLMAEAFAAHWLRRGGGTAAGEVTADPGWTVDGRELEEIRRQVSNARIIGFGLEKQPVTWKIGVKVWEPEKIRMFLDYTWDRLPYLQDRLAAGSDLLGRQASDDGRTGGESLSARYAGVTALAKTLRIKVESGEDSLADAELLLRRLKELTASFLALCFALRAEDHISQDRPISRYTA
jgi:glutamine amidotransferase-like uncharacterized protein